MESLPDELNIMIASYLTSAIDSANYRLTSKYCARIGAEEHFHYFPSGHGTPESAMERMRGILGREELRRCVKGLDFDFNAAAEGEEGVEDVAEDEDDLEEDDEVMRARDQARERAARAERDRIFVLASIASGFRDAEVRIELLQAQNLPFSFFSSSPVQDIVEGGGAG
ncbi:hypothetical protein IQ06DRAFT_298538, partial [Phaeosphaeriaceae sp. SRC1lsM3a]